MITVNKIIPRHSRDNGELVVLEFYLTTDSALMLKGYCSRCQEDVTLLVPISDLQDNCPKSSEYTIKDIAELHNLFRICLPPDLPLLNPPKSS